MNRLQDFPGTRRLEILITDPMHWSWPMRGRKNGGREMGWRAGAACWFLLGILGYMVVILNIVPVRCMVIIKISTKIEAHSYS